jgi:hypothetical protein
MASREEFIKLRNDLYDCMYEKSENGLQIIVESLAWNDSVYRTFNQGLGLSQSKDRAQRLPASLIEYIHHAHTAYVAISLRKLYEDKKQGSRAVNSLRTVTKRIFDNAHLFTRENFVTFDGIPYDEDHGLDWETKALVQARHTQFDALCRIGAGERRRKTDRLDPTIPDMLHMRTALSPKIEIYANKFLAHSSSISNRPDEQLTLQGVTLGRFQTQYRNIIWSTQQIAKFLCEAFLSLVPTPQFDVLMNWESGMFDISTKKKLTVYWTERMEWWRKWTDYYRQGYQIFTSPSARPKEGRTQQLREPDAV